MIYVILAIVAAAIFIMLRPKNKNVTHVESETKLVECSVCGTYAPISECKNKGGKYACSDCA